MKGLERIAKDMERELDEKDRVREHAIRESRNLIRLSKDIIGALNRKRSTKGLMKRMRGDTARLWTRLEGHPDLLHSGYVEAAHTEVVEVCVLLAIVDGARLPAPKELKVTAEAYLLGLADVIGELRRLAVDDLRSQDFSKAEERLSRMEEIHDVLMRFDLPTALVALRKKRDVGRALIERTRGDILVAKGEWELRERMDSVIAVINDSKMAPSKGRRRGRKGRRQRK